MIVKPERGTSEAASVAERKPPVSRRHEEAEAATHGRLRRWSIVLVLLSLIGVASAAAYSSLGQRLKVPTHDLIYYTVNRADLPITVTERGNLESQQSVDILCEVDDVPGDNVNGTMIVWIIPNGSSVKQGDLLVELDEAPHKERLDEQILETEKARSSQIQAQAKYDNQLTQNETSKANAELDVKLAELEAEMFSDDDNGTYKLEKEEIERLIDDVNNEIRAAQANLKLKENEKRGIESLFKLGYAGKSEVERVRLDFLQAEGQFAAKVNKLKTQLASLSKKETYEQEMELLRLQGSLDTARRELVQVQRNNEALRDQARAALDAANESLKKEEERLEHYQEQLTKCKIYAPQDGMVAYATGESRYHREDIREGAPARPRQTLLSLPNLQSMQVKTSVHESVLDQIRQGLGATVRVDAFADRVYRSSVRTVAVLPDPGGFLSSDTKVYQTVVTIDEEVQQLKPGMTAVVEIHVDRLRDILSVPVQAVVQIRKETWCYVDREGIPERRLLKLGRTNDKFVQILEGLDEGDRVVLNPMAILDESEQQETEESQELSSDQDSPDEGLAPQPRDEKVAPQAGSAPDQAKTSDEPERQPADAETGRPGDVPQDDPPASGSPAEPSAAASSSQSLGAATSGSEKSSSETSASRPLGRKPSGT